MSSNSRVMETVNSSGLRIRMETIKTGQIPKIGRLLYRTGNVADSEKASG